jgi:ABC-2 type transport system ATP-binding protein
VLEVQQVKASSTQAARPATQQMIRVIKATKRYGATVAADRVSFEVARGEIVGFLGPNGAGKSTVLKMISTWLPPTSGKVEVAGHDVRREPLAVRRCLGYLPEHNAMYDSMRVDRFLRFMGEVRSITGSHLAERIDWVVGKCTLQAVMRKRINQCSKGYRQRIGLAASLLHDPKVVLLDEPTHGLDPLQVVAFRDFIQELRPERAILFSSHILAEVIAVCERLLIINHGRLLADATVAELRERADADGCSLEEAVLNIVKREKQP